MGGIQTFVNVVKILIKGSTKSTFRNNPPPPFFLGNIPKEYHFFLLLPNNDPINPQAMIPVWRQRIDQSNFFWFGLYHKFSNNTVMILACVYAQN